LKHENNKLSKEDMNAMIEKANIENICKDTYDFFLYRISEKSENKNSVLNEYDLVTMTAMISWQMLDFCHKKYLKNKKELYTVLLDSYLTNKKELYEMYFDKLKILDSKFIRRGEYNPDNLEHKYSVGLLDPHELE